jgi:hypothetical protein
VAHSTSSGQQADLPLGPTLPATAAIVYADVWERPVFALEDPYLADPGLHGAETSYRSRTMTQIKAAPLADAAAIENGSGRYPRIGDAVLAVAQVGRGASMASFPAESDRRRPRVVGFGKISLYRKG